MRIRQSLFLGALLGVALGMAAVIPDADNQHSRSRVIFPNSEINGQPARIMLDTGASLPAITDSALQRLSLKAAPPLPGVTTQPGKIFPVTTAAVQMSAGGRVVTAPFPVIGINSVDAALGWPEVRKNILVFDAASRSVAAVPELPGSTAAWLALKIHAGEVLTVDVPLPAGKTGRVLIDTGSPLGVGLPPAQWDAWRKAHPLVTLTAKRYVAPNIGVAIIQEGWADEIKIGSLTLTDVPVHESPPGEVALFPNFAATLGLYVLSRMDLVTDGQTDMAYLRPLPTPGPPYPSVERPNYREAPEDVAVANADWTVAANVDVHTDPLLAFLADNQGSAARANGNFEDAIADFTQAIELDPKYLVAYFNRGLAKSAKNDRIGAIVDFSRTLLFDPQYVPAWVDRGLARERNSDAEGALADFNRALELDPKQVAALVDRAALKQTQGDMDGALADFGRALEVDPAHISALVGRGRIKTVRGDFAGAMADFDRAIALDPKNAAAFRGRGLARRKSGDNSGAAADIFRATELAIAAGLAQGPAVK